MLDLSVGFSKLVKVGEHVSIGDTLCCVHAGSADALERALVSVQSAIYVSDSDAAVVIPEALIAGIIGSLASDIPGVVH